MKLARRALPRLALFTVALLLAAVVPAFAGQASAGQLFFDPCTSCHPVVPGAPTGARPNGFKGHQIELIGHDKLGQGRAACLVCHDSAEKNPGMLRTIDGTLVDIKGDVSLVCYRCHSAMYNEWKAGAHGKGKPACTAAGCHDPHTPGYIYADSLLPFIGTGFQFQVRPEKHEFTPLAAPAPNMAAPVETPAWFLPLAALGVVVAGGLVGKLIRGRSER